MHKKQTWTRRNVLRTSGAVASVGALAGCIGSGGSSDDKAKYTVTMPPVGEVEFDGVPETWVANNGSWADMGIALGQDPPKALWMTSRYHTQYYDEIPDVSVTKKNVGKNGMVSLYEAGVDVEKFHKINADVHVIDPNFMLNRFKSVKDKDVKTVRGIAPFFGNSIFSTGYKWHKDYPYLSLYEAFEKLAKVFQETKRYEAFDKLHKKFKSNVKDSIPSKEKRPAVAIMWQLKDGQFLPYLIGEGTSFKQWRDLGVRDAFAETDVKDFHKSRGKIGYETLLKIDPDFILLRGNESKTATEFQDTVVSKMKKDNSGQKLTAVQNGDVYRGGPLYQGPITNLVVTERAAKQVYNVDKELFDRQRVSDIVNGNF